MKVADNCAQAIQRAAADVCREITVTGRSAPRWQQHDEEELWQELVSCILGSRLPFEVGVAAARHLGMAGLLLPSSLGDSPRKYENRISKSLASQRYAFPRLRANHIRRSMEALYGSGLSLHDLLEESSTPAEARETMVSLLTGIGPKQASLFLRNIGYADDVAILDTHVLFYLALMGLADQTNGSPQSLRRYETLEGLFCDHARSMGFSVADYDMAVWIVVRVAKRERFT